MHFYIMLRTQLRFGLGHLLVLFSDAWIAPRVTLNFSAISARLQPLALSFLTFLSSCVSGRPLGCSYPQLGHFTIRLHNIFPSVFTKKSMSLFFAVWTTIRKSFKSHL